MAHHILRSHSHLFQEVIKGNKTAEIREDDRFFKVLDTVTLEEYDNINGRYTGQTFDAVITHIISRDTPCAVSLAVLAPGYVILSIQQLGTV